MGKSDWLVPSGVALFLLGGCLLAWLWLMPAEPYTPSFTNDIATIEAQTEEIRAYTATLHLRNFLSWIGEKLLAGGFLMWIAGVVTSRFSAAPTPID